MVEAAHLTLGAVACFLGTGTTAAFSEGFCLDTLARFLLAILAGQVCGLAGCLMADRLSSGARRRTPP